MRDRLTLTCLCSLTLLAACSDDATSDDEVGTSESTTSADTGDTSGESGSDDATTTTTTTNDESSSDETTTTTTTSDESGSESSGESDSGTDTASDTSTDTDTGQACGPECCPGETSCEGEVSLQCNDEGTAWEELEVCDPIQGVSCDANLGLCVGACSANALGLSYIGCDYYPTVTQQYDLYNTAPTHEYAVAVANAGNEDAMVMITQGDGMVLDTVVPAGDVEVIVLPWVNPLTKTTGPSVVVQDGAYRLRSDRPVVVYQYNPLASSASNDASILLPVNAWGPEAYVVSLPYWANYDLVGFYAVTASEDDTTVTLSPGPQSGQTKPGDGVAADGSGEIVLDASDVLQVVSGSGDLTGTRISADKPIQLISGHECTNVPINVTACDHLEESMFPLDTLSDTYIIVPPVQTPNDAQLKAQIVRVMAVHDQTSITFDPDQGSDQVLQSGEFFDLPMSTNAYEVSADKPFMVVQFMVGQSAGYGTSDPAMLLAVPVDQFRSNYLFHAAPTWLANYVDLVAPAGASVSVDGAAVGGWTPVGNSGYSVAHVQLSNAGNGNHEVTADQKVGISVYGVQSYGSYWYPGGLDLTIIPQ